MLSPWKNSNTHGAVFDFGQRIRKYLHFSLEIAHQTVPKDYRNLEGVQLTLQNLTSASVPFEKNRLSSMFRLPYAYAFNHPYSPYKYLIVNPYSVGTTLHPIVGYRAALRCEYVG